ncbi:MAG: histidine kinase [Microlunatus sp.]
MLRLDRTPDAGPQTRDDGGAPPARDRAALALDVVVALSILAAATRVVELAWLEDQLDRTIGYAGVLAIAVILWLGWRRESGPPDGRPARLGPYAIVFTVVVTSLFFIGDQPHPLFLFVVALIMLLRSYGLRAGVLVVATMVGLQAVIFALFGRGWQVIAEQAVGSSLLFGFGLIVAWLFAEIDQQSRANATLAAQARDRAETEAKLTALQERQRVARDLHDGIGHQVTVVMMSLQFAERMSDKDPDRAWAEVAAARGQAAKTLADIRLLARSLATEITP